MADAAAKAGATHVKVQHIFADKLVYRPQFEEDNKAARSLFRPWEREFERLKGLELTTRDYERFVGHVRDQLGLIPVTTCFTRDTIPRIIDEGFREIKVASYDCASYPLIRELADKFDGLIVSTGATFEDELMHTISILKESSKPYSLLHCVTQYPTPMSNSNLSRIKRLQELCSRVGYSDHSNPSNDGTYASKAAIYLGAKIIERHFSILSAEETKDGPVSVGLEETADIINFAKKSTDEQIDELLTGCPEWEQMIGSSERLLSPDELINRSYYRGRFASLRKGYTNHYSEVINNWEETPL
ncbi:N-acetylneuraminate synthase family protein [Synechococcus sp. M16.1]|uniref:N-acetylneuraminate synthase family protein n=1 Tax=Synechococcus sp. M16.1 TaxID=1442553 RepID=UPI001CA41FA5|nr:N-acetylneuraminate synthase family protein [Synechococcus sp. M16.1]